MERQLAIGQNTRLSRVACVTGKCADEFSSEAVDRCLTEEGRFHADAEAGLDAAGGGDYLTAAARGL